jgi:hypothetical protein
MEFMLEPHRGIGPVSFGMTRAEVAAAMAHVGGGVSNSANEQRGCFFNFALEVSFADDGRVDYIEIGSILPLRVRFAGRDVYDTSADELLALVEQFDHFAPELSQPPLRYVFPKLILTLWGRNHVFDYRGGRRPVFGLVGVGTPSYLAAIQAMHQEQS